MGNNRRPSYNTFPRINCSKKRDPRFWARWKKLGFVSANGPFGKPHYDSPVHRLTTLRNLSNQHSWGSTLSLLRSAVLNTGCTLAELSTSENELRQLIVAHHRQDAIRNLKDLRALKHEFAWDALLSNLRRAVRDGGLTLADIGTSESELRQHVVAHHRQDAIRNLKDLRKQNYPFIWDTALSLLRSAVREGGLALSDIGTSEDELRQLSNAFHRQDALRHLHDLRTMQVTFARSSSLSLLRRAVREGSLPLADLGTSEEELAQWERMAS